VDRGLRSLVGPAILVGALVPVAGGAVQTEDRVVVATDVACRVSAETSAAAVASLTAPFDRSRPEDALLAIADHILASDDRPFEEYVRAENLFLDPPWRVVPDSVPVLALRRLQLVDAVVSTEPRWEIEKDSLKYAWILAHEDELVYNEPGGNGYVARALYWDLFERFRGTELAEELAWIAASRPLLGECEGHPDCQLETILRSVAGYWDRFPGGRFLGEAVAAAKETTGLVRRRLCEQASAEHTVPDRILDELRGSLDAVAPVAKSGILEDLEAIERCTSEVTARIPEAERSDEATLTPGRTFPTGPDSLPRIVIFGDGTRLELGQAVEASAPGDSVRRPGPVTLAPDLHIEIDHVYVQAFTRDEDPGLFAIMIHMDSLGPIGLDVTLTDRFGEPRTGFTERTRVWSTDHTSLTLIRNADGGRRWLVLIDRTPWTGVDQGPVEPAIS